MTVAVTTIYVSSQISKLALSPLVEHLHVETDFSIDTTPRAIQHKHANVCLAVYSSVYYKISYLMKLKDVGERSGSLS